MYEGEFFEMFGNIEDTRQAGKVLHKLMDIIFLVFCAVMCGANDWKDIHLWARIKSNQEWMKKYIALQNGIPSLPTIGRLFNIIEPKKFERCFAVWMKDAVDLSKTDVISIDGKTVCGSEDKKAGVKGIHVVY